MSNIEPRFFLVSTVVDALFPAPLIFAPFTTLAVVFVIWLLRWRGADRLDPVEAHQPSAPALADSEARILQLHQRDRVGKFGLLTAFLGKWCKRREIAIAQLA